MIHPRHPLSAPASRLLLALALSLVCPPASTATPAEAPTPRTATGVPKRGNAHFFELHAAHLRRAAAGPVDLLFLGDSITEAWSKETALWESAWGRHRPANFGIGGDRTQHVIWRIDQGILARIKPRVVVLMIGTNNSASDSAADIAEGVRTIVARIRTALPETRVLLLAIFPRGPNEHPADAPESGQRRMEVIREVNASIAGLDDGTHVRFLDIGPKFMTADGSITRTIMPDQLHLSGAGYEIWAEVMAPVVDEMMK